MSEEVATPFHPSIHPSKEEEEEADPSIPLSDPSPIHPSEEEEEEEEADPSIPLSDPSPFHPSIHPSKVEEESREEEADPSPVRPAMSASASEEEEEESASESFASSEEEERFALYYQSSDPSELEDEEEKFYEEEEEEADPSTHPSEEEESSADPSIPLSLGYKAVAADPSLAAPWLFYQSYTEPRDIYAMNCLSDPPQSLCFPLPAELQGYTLASSTGHSLLLQKRGSLSHACLFNPFSTSPSFKRFFSSPHTIATLPPSPALMPPYTPRDLSLSFGFHRIHALVIDPDSRIAFAIMGLHECCVAYTKLPSPGNRWINLTRLLRMHKGGRFIAFQSSVLYKKGIFCAVDRSGNKVLAFDFSRDDSPSPSLSDITLDIPSYRRYLPRTKASYWRCYQCATLITSRSSLFLVRWRTYTFPSNRPLAAKINRHPLGKRIRDRDGCVSKSREIDIHVLRDDDGGKSWAPVHSLHDCSFFIGLTNQSFSMSTADFPGLPPNRVYLSHDASPYIAGAYDDCDDDYQFDDHLVYDLQTGDWSTFLDCHLPLPLVWMMPAARRDAELNSHQKLDS